jgi:hypothetical protein
LELSFPFFHFFCKVPNSFASTLSNVALIKRELHFLDVCRSLDLIDDSFEVLFDFVKEVSAVFSASMHQNNLHWSETIDKLGCLFVICMGRETDRIGTDIDRNILVTVLVVFKFVVN